MSELFIRLSLLLEVLDATQGRKHAIFSIDGKYKKHIVTLGARAHTATPHARLPLARGKATTVSGTWLSELDTSDDQRRATRESERLLLSCRLDSGLAAVCSHVAPPCSSDAPA